MHRAGKPSCKHKEVLRLLDQGADADAIAEPPAGVLLKEQANALLGGPHFFEPLMWVTWTVSTCCLHLMPKACPLPETVTSASQLANVVTRGCASPSAALLQNLMLLLPLCR